MQKILPQFPLFQILIISDVAKVYREGNHFHLNNEKSQQCFLEPD